MFTIRTIKVFEIKTIKEFVDNFDFVLRFEGKPSNVKEGYNFAAFYVDPISKDLLRIGSINIDSSTIENISKSGLNLDSEIIRMVKEDSSLLEPWIA